MTLLSILYSTPAEVICLFFALVLVLVIRLGYYMGARKPKAEGLGTLETSIYALLGLLLAFTFGMGNSRYENRVKIVTEEANNIGTAILRADLYPDSIRKLFREDFKKYVEIREEYASLVTNEKNVHLVLHKAEECQQRIWNRATILSRDPKYQVASMQMIPALNAMFDIVTSRQVANEYHIPESILYLLLILSLSAGFFTGYIHANEERKDWILVVSFALLISMVLYTILDLDRPRRGLVTTAKANKHILDLKKGL